MRTDNQPTGPIDAVHVNSSSNMSEYETNWRSKFPKILVLILCIIQFIFIVLIFILEIAALAVFLYGGTGVGIWCAVPFLPACIFKFILVRMKDGSRKWATIVLIAEILLLIFTFVLIGITGNFVQTESATFSVYNQISIADPYVAKYRIVQAELAFGVLLMFSGFTYIAIYVYVTIAGLWRPFHTLDTNHLFRQ